MKFMKRYALLFSLLLVLCFVPTLSHATLDQEFTSDHALAAGIGYDPVYGYYYTRAQTFTAGLSGDLTRVEFEVDRLRATTGNLQFDLLTTDSSGVPTFTSLASSSLPVSSLPPGDTPIWTGFNLPPGIVVTPGEVLSIALSGPGTDDNVWWLGSNSGFTTMYPGGALYQSVDGSPFTLSSTSLEYDVTFKTYVDTSIQPPVGEVPEPTTMLLLGSGLLGLWGARKKFKK